MKTLVLALALGATLSTAHAANPDFATLDAQRAFRGTYDLDDGKSLTISQRGRTLYAQLDGGTPMELVAGTNGHFTTLSGNTRLEFSQTPNGSVAGVRLISPSK